MTLVFLHGALGSPRDAELLQPHLDLPLVAPCLAGHGGLALPAQLRTDQLATALLPELAALPKPIHVLGYSLGGYLALWLAQHHPDLLASVCCVATKLGWTPEAAARETRLLDPQTLQAKVPRFAQQLADTHGPAWPNLLRLTAEYLTHLGQQPDHTPASLAAIHTPVLLLTGDRDPTATAEETLAHYRALPQGSLGVLPHTPHPWPQQPHALVAQLWRSSL
jgi:pimeloyl-ACP methyl ester carboxylesterase